jgi:chemotaxis protein methyltransferase CheR
LKQMVRFQQFNLQDSFMLMGKFDIILARYVAIYFSDQFKQDLYKKIWRALFGGGTFFLGSSETLGSFSQDFDSKSYHGNVYYQARQDQFEPKEMTAMERVQEMLSKAGLEEK